MSIANIILRISLIILFVEMFIMEMLNRLELNLNSLEETLLDAIFLVLISSPNIYLFVIKPFIIMSNEAKGKFSYLLYHDKLTDLPNRAKLLEWLEHSLHSTQNENISILILDIDSLKVIHENFGLNVVNYVLMELTLRLKNLFNNRDIIAKIEQNQFAFLCEEMGSEDELYLSGKRILSSVEEPIVYDNHKIILNASIGISRYIKDAKSKDDMLKFAHTAMRKAKSIDGDKISFYAQSLTEAVHTTFTLEEDMRIALERNEFFLLYQPKVNSKTGVMVGAEALIRWKHPKKGLISPVDFIPIAEDTGLIISIGEWVIHEALKMFEMHLDSGGKPYVISINLSGKQINSTQIENIINIMSKYRVPKEYIDFEITETCLMTNVEESQVLLEKLHLSGVSISMDDFGTGYSSLAYLKKFQVDIIKIDRMLIKDIENDSNDFVIAKAILAMSHALNLKVVAEGVETKKQVDMLDEIGCDYYQGFYFSRPIEAKSLSKIESL